MYKMIRDTKRQLEDKIGPAVPVCIASGRSPATNKPSRSHPLRIRHALLSNPAFLLLFQLRIYIYVCVCIETRQSRVECFVSIFSRDALVLN